MKQHVRATVHGLALIAALAFGPSGCWDASIGTQDDPDPSGCVDADDDGYRGFDSLLCIEGLDCNDADAGIHAGAVEICSDGIDQNCNGKIDDGCCVASCAGKICGDDGCGASCGSCDTEGGEGCQAGTCVSHTVSTTCDGRCGLFVEGSSCQCDPACFDTGDCCEDICTVCAADFEKQCNGCEPACEDRECGADGCGSTCGTCANNEVCDQDGTCWATACGEVTAIGCCVGSSLMHCDEAGSLAAVDCGDGQEVCGWSLEGGAYACGENDEADPSHVHEMACPDGACVPHCGGKVCGDDGCGSTCGSCAGDKICSEDGKCISAPEEGTCVGVCGTYVLDAPCQCDKLCFQSGDCCQDVCDLCTEELAKECEDCTPSCDGKACGADGCGGSCGGCDAGWDCAQGTCVKDPQLWSCSGTCGSNNASAPCQCDAACFDAGTCCVDVCDACEAEFTDQCVGCVADCAGKQCGDDGCGGDCGGCDDGWTCDGGSCVEIVVAPGTCAGICGKYDAQLPCQCDGACFSIGDCCEDICDTCAADYGEQCAPCEPSCDTSVCGDDGCGGSCGTCGDGTVCEDGACTPTCAGKCGDYNTGEDCHCDILCVKYNDCCAEFCTVCTVELDAQCGCDDGDGDDWGVGLACKGADCNDQSADVHPGATEICGDDIDQDCSGSDLVCAPTGCTSNSDCDGGLTCNPTSGDCVTLSPVEWWAPVVYLDTSSSHPEEDFFTNVDYDNDSAAINNGNNVDVYTGKQAWVYSSFLETSSHWFIGYHFYFPRRYAVAFEPEYENCMRSVLMVVRRDDAYGELELMETTKEFVFQQYLGGLGGLQSAEQDAEGSIQWDWTGGHARPLVFIHRGHHGIEGGDDWKTSGAFPGGTGVVSTWGFQADTQQSVTGKTNYALLSLADTMWTKRFESGAGTLFDQYGRFMRNDADWSAADSLVAWSHRDVQDKDAPWGGFLYDPATLVQRHFDGWGTFGTEYSVNPYALRVDVFDVKIKADTDPIGAGDPDVYINLYLRDGKGDERKVLGKSAGSATQNTWSKAEVAVGTIVNLEDEMGRIWFYGLEYPDEPYMGMEVRDADTGQDDWLMDPDERWYGSFTGTKLLDFVKSDSVVKVALP